MDLTFHRGRGYRSCPRNPRGSDPRRTCEGTSQTGLSEFSWLPLLLLLLLPPPLVLLQLMMKMMSIFSMMMLMSDLILWCICFFACPYSFYCIISRKEGLRYSRGAMREHTSAR